MFINDVNKKEHIKKIVIQTLHKYGIKFRDKSRRQILQVSKCTRFFKVHLQCLENETITLRSGRQLVIPKQLYEICTFIFNRVETEGIFRKEGSRYRQNEIKLLLDRGCLLDDHHVIDVAVILKHFLRELPEPLIPYLFHELFLRCSLIEKKTEAVLLACLLLPTEHLNVLSFLMQFFNEVATYSHYNKMNSGNIATMVGPNIFPISEKVDPKSKLMVTKSCNIIKILIENSQHVGEIPDYIIEQIGSSGTVRQDDIDLKLKRRSGSFTRIFHGLKRMVGTRSEEEILTNTVTPDLLLTPSCRQSVKRRYGNTISHHKSQENFSNRKSGSNKVLERRWSSVAQKPIKKIKRNSLGEQSNEQFSTITKQYDKSRYTNQYLQLPDNEYEEIKNRVCKIEKELSRELENVKTAKSVCNVNIDLVDPIDNIQSAYEQTLVQNEPLSPTTDHVARRLSKELRIRTSEQKIIRSPSARKIGNMKRRSREFDRPNSKIFKSSSFQLTDMKHKSDEMMDNHFEKSIFFHDTHAMNKLSSHLSVDSLNHVRMDGSSTNSFVGSNVLSSPTSMNFFQKKNLFPRRKCISVSAENLSRDVFLSNGDFERNSVDMNQEDLLKIKCSKVKSKVLSTRKNVNLKQKKKNDKMYVFTNKTSTNSKENVMEFTEKRLMKESKYLDKYPVRNIPQIKKSLITKSPKHFCSTPLKSVRTPLKGTPLKVLSTSQCFNTIIPL